jgi:2'-5' RNA ligase
LIVRVPEAEPLVGALRSRYDATAALGVPAHITILVPFVPPSRVTTDVLRTVERAIANIHAFDFTLGAVCRWPETVYLAADPAEPFAALTRSIVRHFPEFPPYAGRHSPVIPHLTVADGDVKVVQTAEAELCSRIRAAKPVRGFCSELELIENSSGRWKKTHVIRLAS